MLKTNRHGRAMFFLVACFLVVLSAGAGRAVRAQSNWDVEIVPTTNPPTGGAPSLAFDPTDGNPSIAYAGVLPPNYGMVRLAHWDGAAWENVDVGLGDQPTLRFNNLGIATVLYRSLGKGQKWELRLMTRSGSTWTSETIDTGIITYRPELAYDTAGNPSTVYMKSGKSTSTSIVFARRIGSTWVKETVDGSGAGGGITTSLAYDPSGNPSTVYTKNGNIVLARKSGSSWTYQTIEPGEGHYLNLAYEPSGNPVIVYSGLDVLRYLSWDGAAWVGETVGVTLYAQYLSLAVDDLGTPFLAYTDFTDPNENMYYGIVSWKTDAGWVSETILTMNMRGVSLALDWSQVPAVVFHEGGIPYSAPQNLWYALRNSRP